MQQPIKPSCSPPGMWTPQAITSTRVGWGVLGWVCISSRHGTMCRSPAHTLLCRSPTYILSSLDSCCSGLLKAPLSDFQAELYGWLAYPVGFSSIYRGYAFGTGKSAWRGLISGLPWDLSLLLGFTVPWPDLCLLPGPCPNSKHLALPPGTLEAAKPSSSEKKPKHSLVILVLVGFTPVVLRSNFRVLRSSPKLSMTLLSRCPLPQVEPSMGFVKIDFIIIKCLFKQMPPPFHTPGDGGRGWGFGRTISHHSEGNMQRHSPGHRVRGVGEGQGGELSTPL